MNRLAASKISLTTAFLAAFLAASSLPAQPQPAFEVATVKQSPPPSGDLININLGRVKDGILTMSNVSLSDCLRFAYSLVSDAQIAGPDWIKSKFVRFDIVGKAPAGISREQFPAMLQALLADRLKLRFHYEKKDLPHLALVIGKNGSKLQPAKANAPAGGGSVAGHIRGNDMPMLTLATLLSRFERQTVVDQTGLAGRFEVNLEWAPDTRPLPPSPAGDNRDAALSDSRPSLFTAVEEQLGLKLESRKGPVDVLVVDHAEQVPAEN